jgi:hypothetical protein
MLACLALLAAAPARAADTAAAPITLKPVATNTTVNPASATVTPADYQARQTSAPEEVVIRVTAVKAESAKVEDNTIGPDAKLVTARAVVLQVLRSKTHLKIGAVIYLLYSYAPPAPGQPGAPPIPIVRENTDYHAFLSGGPADTPYRPAAGAQSLLDPNALAAATPSPDQPPAPFADPAILPTPGNPRPPGAIHLTGDNLAQFVQLVQAGAQWGASIAHADPLPLQTQGDTPPELIAYYSAPLGAPAAQPTVLLYRASVRPADSPAAGTLTFLRALVIGHDGRLLGDAPWARILSDDSQPPLPAPTWAWSSYKVDVTDPDTQKVQTILLTPPSAPPPAAPADTTTK